MKISTSLLLTVLLCVPVSSVAQATTPLTPDEKKAKLRESTVVFLRETYSDIGNLRSLENRISFTSELAALLWYHDQKEASTMFGTAVGDFKQLLAAYDSQMNAFGPIKDDESGGGFGAFMQEPTDRSRIAKKFRTAMGVRQQIAMSIAEHEPELAYNFFHDSMNAITNAEFRKQMETGDANYEQQLINRIAETNVKQAAELSKRSLTKGFTSAHVDLLRRLHGKDPDAAVEFGAALLSRLKDTSSDKLETHSVSALLNFGDELMTKPRTGTVKPVYSKAQMTEIAEIYAKIFLEKKELDDYASPNMTLIEKYSPGRAVQLKAKLTQRDEGLRNPDRYSVFESGSASPPPPPAVYRGPVRTTSVAANTSRLGSDIGTSSDQSPAEKERAAREEAEREMQEGVAKLGQKDLPKEEREKIVAKAREMIAKTTGRDKKIVGLSMLAASVAKAGDKQLASEIMREAAALVNPQPKTYLDFMYSWMLASGYAVAEPDKAFPVLDDAIFRVNELISSVVRIAEFVDVNEEVIADGEFQVGAFGGQMIRGMTGSVGMADSTITSLIDADFEKTKALTNRFERSEVRVLAKMMILRSVLGKEAKPGAAITEDEIGEDIDIN